MKTPLGRMQAVELRDYWLSEAADFTPWLAETENIKLLGDAIGLELEVEAQEKDVGPFRADILCRDVATEQSVLIENQLERTDHGHLGQLLTYAAGLDAVTIVWVAAKFTDEHRAALDWLNEITADRFAFFGLEVELWRIGDGPAAPKFNVVSKPNDWTKVVRERANSIDRSELGATKKLQLEYWLAFGEYLKASGSRLVLSRPRPHQSVHVTLGRSGIYLTAVASAYNTSLQSFEVGEVRAELGINGENAPALFGLLKREKDRIEAEVGEPLVWYEPANAQRRKIQLIRKADIEARDTWGEQHAWLREKLEKLDVAFRQRVRKLDAADFDA